MVPLFSPVSSMMSRSQKIQTISRKWKHIAKLGLVPNMNSDDNYWMAEDSSLEHQVTITILSTASMETENAHFLVSQYGGGNASDGDTASILSDLANEEQLLSPRFSRSRGRWTSTKRCQSALSTALPVPDVRSSQPRSTSLDSVGANKSVPSPSTVDHHQDHVRTKMSTSPIQFVESFDPLELDEEPLPQFALIDSFDSISWGHCEDMEKGGSTISSDSESYSPEPKKMVRTKTEIDRNGFPKLAD